MKDSYTRDAINNLRLKVAKIEKGIKKAFFMPAWDKLAKRAKLQRKRNNLVESQVAYKRYLKIKDGQTLLKLHYGSNGERKEFFKIVDAKTLRWCAKPEDINKPKNRHSYELSQVRGLVYGKVTSTFQKKRADKFYPWLCMSIIMEQRPYDVVCDETNVNDWYIGLAYAIKKHNPDAVVLGVGKFFWRKMRHLIHYLVFSKMPKNMKSSRRRDPSFAQLIIQFSKLKYQGG